MKHTRSACSITALTLSMLFSFTLKAQYKIELVVRSAASLHQKDSLFVAGSFNNWNPAASALQFDKVRGSWYTIIEKLPAEIYEFKFTRGSWNKVQTSATGQAVENNMVKLNSDTLLEFLIQAWGDDFISVPKQHSVSSNVHIMDTAFAMPELNTKRRIWIYLPPGYERAKKKYPVLYMHDGQNLFDNFTSGYGEWGIDEWMDSLTSAGKPPCIVVGIDNGPRRMNEYNPFDNERFGPGDGDAYVQFLVHELKPYIDRHYRSIPTKEATIIAGSSMGGLISYYAMLKHPETFSKAGIFSPAFWTAPAIEHLTDSLGAKTNGKFFFYAGGLEGETMVPDMLRISESLGAKSTGTIYCLVDPESRHNETAWRKWFRQFYLWVMTDGNNFVVDIEKDGSNPD